MSNKNQYHISKNLNNGWKVTQQSRVLSVFETQKQTIGSARYMAQVTGGETVIHGRDGKIRDKNSYGNDPFPPIG